MKKSKQKKIATKRKEVRAGEIWVINDGKTKGHKTLITKNSENFVKHIPITHSPFTRKIKNYELEENPKEGDLRKSHILTRVQISQKKYLGREHPEYKIKNPIDKSKIRHVKKKSKQKKMGC